MPYTYDSRKDVSAADNDKSWVVPVGETWEIPIIAVDIETSATVANRIIEVEVIDSDGTSVLVRLPMRGAVAASAHYYVSFMTGSTVRDASILNYSLYQALPMPFLVLGGQTLRVFDSANCDAAGDVIKVYFPIIIHAI